MEGQSPYMDVNTFLEKFYNLYASDKVDTMRIVHLLNNTTFVEDVIANKPINLDRIDREADQLDRDLRSEAAKELVVPILAALRVADKESIDFLQMASLLTIFHLNVDNHHNYDESIRLQTYLINNDRIKKPEISYKMLRSILRKLDNDLGDPRRTPILHMLALHPMATPHNLEKYAVNVSTTRDPEVLQELRSLLTKQMAQVDKRIDDEKRKDFPNQTTIEEFGIGSFGNIALYIKDIVEGMARTGTISKEEVAPAKALIDILRNKYDINTIMASEPNYIEEYQQSLEMRFAELREESAKKDITIQQQQDKNGQLSNTLAQTQQRLDDAEAQIKKLTKEKADLEEALKSDRTEIAALRGAIKLFIDDATKRANGSVFNKGNDLSEQIERFARQIHALNKKQAQI